MNLLHRARTVTARRDRLDVEGDAGNISVIGMLLVTPVFLGLLAIAVDIGGAWVQKTHVHGTALEAARAAVDQLAESGAYTHGDFRSVNPGRATKAACDLAAQDDPGTACTATIGPRGEVTVTITTTYRCQLLGMLGRPTIQVGAHALVRPAIGGSRNEVSGG